MKQNILPILFLVFSSLNILVSQRVSSLDEILPKAVKEWEKPVQGVVMDIEVPKFDNHVYYVTEDEDKFRLYKTTLDGNQVWIREWDKGKPYHYVYGLKVSNWGNLVCVHSVDGSDENVRTRVYDGDGNLTYYSTRGRDSKGYKMGFYYPSPSGLYLSYEETNGFSPLEIFTTKGEVIEIENTSLLKGERHKHRFVAKDRLLVYEGFKGRGYLYLITVPDGNVSWTFEFDSPFWLIDFNERNCNYTDKYIAIQGTRRPSDLYLFDYGGNLIWKVGGLYSNHAISFSNNWQKVMTVDEGRNVVVIDVRTGKMTNKIYVDPWSLLNRPQFEMLENTLLITQADGIGNLDEKIGVRYFSHIISLNPDGSKNEHMAIKGVISTKYDAESGSMVILNAEIDKQTITRRTKLVEE
ncbi:MAG: hypothetical protein ACE5EE_01380 [Fidelibacterota bacterium]